jgi:hypothetical protein
LQLSDDLIAEIRVVQLRHLQQSLQQSFEIVSAQKRFRHGAPISMHIEPERKYYATDRHSRNNSIAWIMP